MVHERRDMKYMIDSTADGRIIVATVQGDTYLEYTLNEKFDTNIFDVKFRKLKKVTE